MSGISGKKGNIMDKIAYKDLRADVKRVIKDYCATENTVVCSEWATSNVNGTIYFAEMKDGRRGQWVKVVDVPVIKR